MSKEKNVTQQIDFDDNRLLPFLFGENDRHLNMIADKLSIVITARGNHVWIQGQPSKIAIAQTALGRLYDKLKSGHSVGNAEVDAALRMASPVTGGGGFQSSNAVDDLSIATRRRVVSPRTDGQARYMEELKNNELVFGIGPAGTGKTFIAVAVAVSHLLSGAVKRIILSRPAVEAGERLGFLPGDMKEKVDPYLRPLYDALFEMLPHEGIQKRFESGEIEVAPLAFMRGRTLSNAFIILDEAQNTTQAQMKMFLTRMGDGSRMVITGDLSQIDLPIGVGSGLKQAINLLHDIDGIAICQLTSQDIVRHPLVNRIVKAYDCLRE